MKRSREKAKGIGPKTRDYFAELYVAGMMGDRGWAIYFPKRDVGFDFVASKTTPAGVILRPVQVRGRYPTAEKKDRTVNGWTGELSQVHPEMAVVLCFFSTDHRSAAPEHVAFLPLRSLKQMTRGRWRCFPTSYRAGHAEPRKTYKPLFGIEGLDAMELPHWHESGPTSDNSPEGS